MLVTMQNVSLLWAGASVLVGGGVIEHEYLYLLLLLYDDIAVHWMSYIYPAMY